MKNYKDLLLELHSNKSKECSFSFGRFQPVTIGHELVFADIASSGNDGFVFVSPNKKNPKDNPISSESRTAAIKKLAPSLNVIDTCHTIMDVIKFLDGNGYTNATMYVGSDRTDSFKDALQDATIDVSIKQVGQDRNDSSDALDGVSGSSLRKFAIASDFDSFKDNIPDEIADEYALDWYNDIRRVNELSAQTTEDILREAYHQGNVFRVGSFVVNENNEVGRVIARGDNYVSVVHFGGQLKKYWLTQLTEKIASDVEFDMFSTKTLMGGQVAFMGYQTTNLTGSRRTQLIEEGLFDSTDKLHIFKTLKNIDFGTFA